MKKRNWLGVSLCTTLLLTACGSQSALKVKKDAFTYEYGEVLKIKTSTYIDADKDVLEKTSIDVDIKKSKEASKIKDKKGNVISISNLDLGTYTATAKYKEDKVDFTIEVKDTTKPVFVESNKEIIKIEKGSSEDLTAYFAATDLFDVTITVDTSKVDFNVPGIYEAKAIAKDKNKNKATKKFKIEVKEVLSAEDVQEKEAVKNVVATAPTKPNNSNTNKPNSGNGNIADSGGTSTPPSSDAGNSGTTNPPSTGGGNNGGGGNSGGGTTPPPVTPPVEPPVNPPTPVCPAGGVAYEINESGTYIKAFYNYEEAIAFGESSGNRYMYSGKDFPSYHNGCEVWMIWW